MATKIFSSLKEVTEDVNKRFVKAGINTVNIVAATARNNAIRNIQSNFTLRNNFTASGVKFTKCGANVKTLSEISSETGIDERRGYMARQEEGGVRKSTSGANLVIPHTRARKGQSNSGLISSRYRYTAIKQNLKRRQDDSKMALAIAAFNAAQNRGFIRIDNTIFQVSKFEPKRDNRMFIAKPVLNLKFNSTVTPKKEWLRPASEQAANLMQRIFNSEMDKL